MSTEDNNTDTQTEIPTSSLVEQPDVPTPAGPIGQSTNKPNYTTNDSNFENQVRITEDSHKGGGDSDQ